MRKMTIATLLALGMLASGLVLPAFADAPTLPAAPNIVDDKGDAETNSSQGDLWHAWFTEEKDTISIHWNNAAAPPPAAYGTEWRIMASPDADGKECLLIRAQVPAGAFVGAPLARIFDACGAGTNWFDHPLADGEVEYGAMSEGGYITATFEKSATPLIGDGATIAAPRATAHFIVGTQDRAIQPVLVDESDPGTDYKVGGGSEGGPVVEPPGKNDPPGQGNQNCAKIKDKKKKKACKKNSKGGQGKAKGPKKPPPAKGCAAYTPGEMGAEAETAKVTEKHTEDAPLEIEIPMDPATGSDFGLGQYDGTARVPYNVQLDVAAAEGGFFMKLESPEVDDPDLYVYWDNGTRAAVAGGFNQALPAGPLPAPAGEVTNGTGSGGHSGFGYEQIDGLRTADCGGWTLDLVNWGGVGGTYTLKLWVGEIQNDPAPRE